MVIRVPSLPNGRRVAKVEGHGLIGWAILEKDMSAEAAAEMEEMIQHTLDAGGWSQNWDWAMALMMTTAQQVSTA
ncbi:hypothetical protein [Streptomyces tateyamensis]|nr:hypothetical protein [Streptomyces tateyamensis]